MRAMSEKQEIDPATVAAVDPEALEETAMRAVREATSTEDLDRVRVEYLGRKSQLKLALREVRDRNTGMQLNKFREALEMAISVRQEELRQLELDRRLAEERVDVTIPGTPVRRGHLHLITQIRREFEDIFLGLGYTVVDGREVETTHYNFDALNFPLVHPTRSPLHTLFLDEEPPVYIVSPGRCYRRDPPDATHTPIFHQVEGLAVDEGITLADLEGTLDYLLRELFGQERRSQFVTHYFPFRNRRSRRSCPVTSATAPAVPSVGIRAGSRSAVPGWSIRTSSSSSATTRSGTRGSPSAGDSSGSPCSGTAFPI